MILYVDNPSNYRYKKNNFTAFSLISMDYLKDNRGTHIITFPHIDLREFEGETVEINRGEWKVSYEIVSDKEVII